MEMNKLSNYIPNFGLKGWGIAGLGICFYYLSMSVFDVGLNTLVGTYNEMYGWSITQIMFFVSLGGWLAVLGIVIFGAVCKKKGARFVSIIGLFLVAMSFVILAFSRNMAVFAVGILMYFVCATSFGVVGVGQFGANWFPRTKGMYMGIVTMGITLAGATINLVMHALIPGMGLTGFMLVCAAACIVIAGLAALNKNYPEEAGAYPDNDKSVSRKELDAAARTTAEYKKNSPWNLKKVLSTPETWKLAIGWGIPMLASTGVMGQLVPLLITYGHDPMFGIMLLSSMWPCGMLGNYLAGIIDQRFGTKAASLMVVFLEAFAAILMLLFGANAVTTAVAVGLFMFAISGCTNISMSMTSTVFGRNDFENAWPVVSVISKIIMSSGVLIIAVIAEKSSYNTSFVTIIALVIIAFIIMLFTKNRCITVTNEEKR
jgi:predicted MFS family arabinose efflux permease